MRAWPLDSPLTGCTILSSVPSTWMKASEKEVTDAIRESAGTHEADGSAGIKQVLLPIGGRAQAGSR
jgi:hypothetical protein